MVSELAFDAGIPDHPGPPLVDFEDGLAAVSGVRNAADGKLVDLTTEALTKSYWQGHGVGSPVQWLMWQVGLSRATARRVTTLAARACDLPVTLGLLRQGLLSLDQAHAVARYTPAEYEASVCNLAQCATVSQIINATRGYGFDVEKPSKPRQEREREMSFGHDEDGSWWARIRLGAEEGALVESALGQVKDVLHDAARDLAKAAALAEGRSAKGTDAELGVAPTSWADAMVGIANSVLSHGVSDATAKVRRSVHIHLQAPERPPAPARPGASAPRGAPTQPGASARPAPATGESAGEWAWVAELHGGARLPNWLTRKLTCDCDIDLVWERHGKPLSSSATHRTPNASLRRAVERRDRYHCRVPGCTEGRWLEVHHIVHWEDQGPTLSHNLVCLCARHHRMHHQGLIGISGDADVSDGPSSDRHGGLIFTNQHGLRIENAGVPTAPGPGDFPRAEKYRHPTGERLQRRHVHFNRSAPAASSTPESDGWSGLDAEPASGLGVPVGREAAASGWLPN